MSSRSLHSLGGAEYSALSKAPPKALLRASPKPSKSPKQAVEERVARAGDSNAAHGAWYRTKAGEMELVKARTLVKVIVKVSRNTKTRSILVIVMREGIVE